MPGAGALDGVGEAEDGGQQRGQRLEERGRGAGRQREVQRAQLGAAPARRLQHEALGALQHQLRAPRAPRHRHLLRAHAPVNSILMIPQTVCDILGPRRCPNEFLYVLIPEGIDLVVNLHKNTPKYSHLLFDFFVVKCSNRYGVQQCWQQILCGQKCQMNPPGHRAGNPSVRSHVFL